MIVMIMVKFGPGVSEKKVFVNFNDATRNTYIEWEKVYLYIHQANERYSEKLLALRVIIKRLTGVYLI